MGVQGKTVHAFFAITRFFNEVVNVFLPQIQYESNGFEMIGKKKQNFMKKNHNQLFFHGHQASVHGVDSCHRIYCKEGRLVMVGSKCGLKPVSHLYQLSSVQSQEQEDQESERKYELFLFAKTSQGFAVSSLSCLGRRK